VPQSPIPADLTADVAREHHLTIDMSGFEIEMTKQRERARQAGDFKTLQKGVDIGPIHIFFLYLDIINVGLDITSHCFPFDHCRPTNNFNYVLTGYQDILVILYLRVLSLKRVVNLVSKVIMFMMLQFQECRLKIQIVVCPFVLFLLVIMLSVLL
jgi:hypothetical protein